MESVEGRGSSFQVSILFGKSHLPADRVKETPALADFGGHAAAYVTDAQCWLSNTEPENPDSESRHAATTGAARPRVVLADDNADMRDYVGRLLSRAGFEVVPASDGEKALAACLANPPDLLLADVMMPKLDGFGLVARLRGDVRTALLPIILLSARAGEGARIEGLRTGADDYLVKPFEPGELLVRAEAAVRLAQAPVRRR